MSKRRGKSDVIRAIVFDLDGTLIDSYPGIRASLNYAIRFHESRLCLRGLRKKIGPPISKMVNSLWPKLDQKNYEKILQRFRRHYDREGCLRSRMYPGARKMLVGMKKTGKKAFLLTNKPATATNRILHQLKIESFFVEVVCPDSVSPPLGHKKEGALLLRQKHRLLSGETLLVGDSQDDMVAAGAAGFQFGIALYGYGGLSRDPDRSYFLVLKSPRDFGKLARTMYKKIYD